MAEETKKDVVRTERAPIVDESEFADLKDTAKFEHLYRVAQAFSRSKLVPAHFQSAPDDCFVALQMAFRMKIDPFMLMQKVYVIQGKPGMEATLALALANQRGPFTGPIQWTFTGAGKDRACMAYAVHRQTGERCEATVTWAMVEAEGWSKKNGSKWLTIPEQMFAYRSAMFLIRRYCPEVILGMHSKDEVEDLPREAEIVAEPVSARRARAIAQIEQLKGMTPAMESTPGTEIPVHVSPASCPPSPPSPARRGRPPKAPEPPPEEEQAPEPEEPRDAPPEPEEAPSREPGDDPEPSIGEQINLEANRLQITPEALKAVRALQGDEAKVYALLKGLKDASALGQWITTIRASRAREANEKAKR